MSSHVILRPQCWYRAKGFSFALKILLIVVLPLPGYSADVTFSADRLIGFSEQGERCHQLEGNAKLLTAESTIEADRAVYYSDQKIIRAAGHVRIVRQDGTVIEGEELVYDESTQTAHLRQEVVYRSQDGNTVFYTDNLSYDYQQKVATFQEGGRLVSGSNVLTGEAGRYNDVSKRAELAHNVTLETPEHTLKTDTLCYNTYTKVARFLGPTEIVSKRDSATLTTEQGGEYNTATKSSLFSQSRIETQDYYLSGDLLYTDPATETYTAIGHVQLASKANQVVISGQHGRYCKKEGVAQIEGSPLMQKKLEDDTLYLYADRFVATENLETKDPKHMYVEAYDDVKIYKEGFQGRAAKMEYRGQESTIRFYDQPIFWSQGSQLSARAAEVTLHNDVVDRIDMYDDASVMSEDELHNYNQLKGRIMTAHLENQNIDHIDVEGNAESLYFVIDRSELIGLNHLRCGQMRIDMHRERGISKITFNVKPVGVFWPIDQVREDQKILPGLQWNDAFRPTREEVVGRGYGLRSGYPSFKFDKQ